MKTLKAKADKAIKKSYQRKGRFTLPFYLDIGSYAFMMYALDENWDSLRIKIEREGKILKVFKKGAID